jgi:pimeloyl-ACP methyl ester carboxylesterase
MEPVKPAAVAPGRWDVRESGPLDAEHTVLLLPGGMCTTVAMEPIMDALAPAAIRVVAATLPGFGRTWHPDDLSMENYAALAGKLAADIGADVVAGHSLGANVALEMVAAGGFYGPVALLSPSFSREDEAKELGTMNSIGRVPGIGLLAWTAMLKVMPRAMKSKLPAESADVFATDLANNDPRFCRALVRNYFKYLDRHGSLVPRLCDSSVKAVVAFGDDDEIGLTDEERRGLEASADVSLVTITEATHFMVVEQPAQIAKLICELAGVASTPVAQRS